MGVFQRVTHHAVLIGNALPCPVLTALALDMRVNLYFSIHSSIIRTHIITTLVVRYHNASQPAILTIPANARILSAMMMMKLLPFLFLPLALATILRPPDLRAHVAHHLRNGGQRQIQRLLNLPPHVHYDPLRFFTRETRYIANQTHISPTTSAHRASDLDILRAMRLYVPGVDSHNDLLQFRNTIRSSRQISIAKNPSGPPVLIAGSKSRISVLYSDNTPPEARQAVQFAIRKWTDAFESDVTLRIRYEWKVMDPTTLGAATSPFFSDTEGKENLRDDAVYSPALASALQGQDLINSDDAHVHLMLNERIAWHFDVNTAAPNHLYDLSTTVLHELTHGLFFAGTVQGDGQRESATYVSNAPGRFDQFVQVDGNIGVARSCRDKEDLYNAITNPTVRFVDAPNKANFGLYAPVRFVSGSSMYHFNNTEHLFADCARNDISREKCSDLMTHELHNGYTQRNLGDTTIRIYNAMRSRAAGLSSGRSCDLPDSATLVSADPSSISGTGPESANVAFSTPFTLPLWAIATVGVIGGVGVLLVFGVVISSISSRE